MMCFLKLTIQNQRITLQNKAHLMSILYIYTVYNIISPVHQPTNILLLLLLLLY